MNETCLAEALLVLVRDCAPKGGRVREVYVEAGPVQAIDGKAMEAAWGAVTKGTEFAGSRLALEILPWALTCRGCGRSLQSGDLFGNCRCGTDQKQPARTAELRLVSLEVEEQQLVT